MTPIQALSHAGPTALDLLATGQVKRWHTKATIQSQTLADHLAKVALLADWLGLRLGKRYTREVALDALRWALAHDLPEVEHGDIPSPAKAWLNKRILLPGPEVAGYDELVCNSWWMMRGWESPLPDETARRLVAVADILEAATWFWVYGLDADLKASLVFDTLTACRQHLPDLMCAVGEALAAAGVPEELISEAAA